MVPDEPLLSPKRLWFAVMQWLYYQRQGVTFVTLPHLLRYHRRPWASDRDGVY